MAKRMDLSLYAPLPPIDVLTVLAQVDAGQIDAILQLGVPGLLAVAVLALVFELVVPGKRYREVKDALDKLQDKQATLIDSQGRLIETLESQRRERTP